MWSPLKKELIDLSFIFLGISLAFLGINGFLLPNGFIDGGVTGLSMLVSKLWNVDLATVIFLINSPFVFIASRRMGLVFSLKSALTIAGFATMLHFLHFPLVTEDKILSAIFGGIALGSGIGFAFRGAAVLDGTEVVALLLSKRFGIRVGDVILSFNVVLFSVAAVVLGLESALYSVLTYLSASKAIDFVVYGFELLGMNIVAENSKKIRDAINENLGLSVTIFNGERGFTKKKQDILFCVCGAIDANKVKELATRIDPNAFITMHKIKETYGGGLQRQYISIK
ncbi:hypothetical protein DID78_00070 [Candidatus Marinamargulisbacteria bacterium SCGC AG-343-D04]|nr:hypothetical protein DID78_00070 [Candidatus Marinamargulisbacteria bacterium SCGC AG-343-D04]